MLLSRWNTLYVLVVSGILVILYFDRLQTSSFSEVADTYLHTPDSYIPQQNPVSHPQTEAFDWASIPTRYPVTTFKSIPTGAIGKLPKVQAEFQRESSSQRFQRLDRLAAVKSNFTHAWTGYKNHAWLHDEVRPLSGAAQNPFGGWAATLVDALDTLCIMGMSEEFEEAVSAISRIDFSTSALEDINVFETTIRYLGGFLAAYDLSGNPKLLGKAKKLGNMLYKAFDTPNRMPLTRWKFRDALRNMPQEAPRNTLLAEPGSLTLEFTRLSQITGDMRYFDAVQRVMNVLEGSQMKTKLPGMWPVNLNLRDTVFDYHGVFTIGGMADSTYEYLPKQHILLGGATSQYQKMYNASLTTMKRNIFYRPMTKDGRDILFAGQVHSLGRTATGQLVTEPQAQHLGCFAGGMVALAAKIFQSDADLEIGKKLVEGCLWAYETMPGGIMPEIIHTLPCSNAEKCDWDNKAWVRAMVSDYHVANTVLAEKKFASLGLPHGVMKVDDPRYILRPEAIESIFILYRITGDKSLQDRAWNMFNSIISKTKTDIAHAGLLDCTLPNPPKQDRMESFWLAETLKYFYLIFSEPDLISLDEYVLNTEAHPLKRSL